MIRIPLGRVLSGRSGRLPHTVLFVAVLLGKLAWPAPVPAVEWACPEASGDALCGHATCGDSQLTVADALLALKTAVGGASCSACRCDTDASGTVVASDAARILAASVEQPVILACPPCNSLTVDLSEEPFEPVAPLQQVLPVEGGGFVAAWIEANSVIMQKLDSDLGAVEGPTLIASSTENLGGLYACSHENGGLGLAWEAKSAESFPAPHDYVDLGNVKTARTAEDPPSSDSLDAHPVVNGTQSPLGVVCLSSGQTGVLWVSRCSGLRAVNEGMYTSLTPANCPLNGIWMRRFGADGQPTGEPTVVLRTYSQWYLPWMPAAPMPDGRVVLSSTDRLVVLNVAGQVEADIAPTSSANLSLEHDCRAGAGHCVGVYAPKSVIAVVYDADNAAELSALQLRPSESFDEPPYRITIRGRAAHLACDVNGICLVTWTLWREEEDFDTHHEDSTNLGQFARAFNARTGETGHEVPFPGSTVRNLAPGRFLTGDPGGGARIVIVH